MPENGLNDAAAEAPGSARTGLPAEPAEPADRPEPAGRRRLALITARSGTRPVWWAPWLIAGFVCAVYLALSLFRYLQLSPSSWDLGIFTEQVKQYAHLHAPVADVRGAGFNLLGDHFSPLVALIAPFFAIAPSPITLLVAQAVLTAVSVLPVTWVAAEKLGRRAGAAIGLAYGLSWGLQQMVDFDFHEIAFAVPLLAFSLAALVRGRYRSTVAWALPLVFVKEDQGFTVAAIGILMIGTALWRAGRPGRAGSSRAAMLGGQFLLVWGMAWSVLAIAVIIPHFNPAHHYLYWNDGGTLSPGGHFSAGGSIAQFFTAWPTKLQTTLLLLLPTAFIALWSPLSLIALPTIVLRFLGTNSNFWGTQYHYNATVMTILFLAAIDAMGRLRDARPQPSASSAAETAGGGATAAGPPVSWRTALNTAIERHGAVAMLTIAAALIFQFPLAGLWQPSTYRLGSHVADARAAMARVPDGATVSTTLDLLAPLAARTDTFWIGNAGNPDTAYIVFDATNSGYDPEPANIPSFIASQHPGVKYQVIYDTGDVWVFRRAGA
jgi:uncharacterized membrane protein